MQHVAERSLQTAELSDCSTGLAMLAAGLINLHASAKAYKGYWENPILYCTYIYIYPVR